MEGAVMKIYYIDTGHTHFFGTKAEALKAARESAKVNDTTVSVELCTIPDNRAAMIALANGITSRGELIATIGPAYGRGRE